MLKNEPCQDSFDSVLGACRSLHVRCLLLDIEPLIVGAIRLEQPLLTGVA